MLDSFDSIQLKPPELETSSNSSGAGSQKVRRDKLAALQGEVEDGQQGEECGGREKGWSKALR